VKWLKLYHQGNILQEILKAPKHCWILDKPVPEGMPASCSGITERTAVSVSCYILTTPSGNTSAKAWALLRVVVTLSSQAQPYNDTAITLPEQ